MFDRIDQISVNGYSTPVSTELASSINDASFPDQVAEECRAPVVQIFRDQIAEIGFDPAAIDPDSELVSDYLQDPAMDTARESWASCLTSQGYPDPRTLASPSEGSIQMALADSACRGISGFRDAKVSWFKEHVLAWLDQNAEIVVQSRRYWEGLVRRAITLANGD